jgi:hypothetical protein
LSATVIAFADFIENTVIKRNDKPNFSFPIYKRKLRFAAIFHAGSDETK